MLYPSCCVCNSAAVQVLRALQPPLTADMCSTLLSCLQQCLAAADASHVAPEVALELLLTLRSLLEALPARKLLLYPQVCDGGFVFDITLINVALGGDVLCLGVALE
jgi:hypothetical protein